MRRDDGRPGARHRPRTRVVLATLGSALMLAVALPLAAGVRAHPIDAGSTGDTLRPGGGVITVPIAPRHATVGDLVTFPAPGGGDLVTRRVVRIELIGAIAAVETRRDGATGSERWQVAADGSIGRVVGQVPLLGHLLGAFLSTAGRVLLLGTPAVGLAVLAVAPRVGTDHRAAEAAAAAGRSPS